MTWRYATRLFLVVAFIVVGAVTWNVTTPALRDDDLGRYGHLVELRNALAHGNEARLSALRAQGRDDTVSWGRTQLPVLNRIARSLDQLVWDRLRSTTGTAAPWR